MNMRALNVRWSEQAGIFMKPNGASGHVKLASDIATV
jgi:hypothetical protein